MQIIHDAQNRQFEAVDDSGEHMGEISYEPRDGGILVADHTGVAAEFRGQDVAKKLLAALVDHARANNLRILPICSYVVTAFKRHPEQYKDVMLKTDDPLPFM